MSRDRIELAEVDPAFRRQLDLSRRVGLGPECLSHSERVPARIDGPIRLGGKLDASGRAVKGVAIGVMGTGFIAGIAAWIGFTIAGVSIAGGLAAITFFLVVIQLGPLFVFLPVVIWLASQGETGMAIFMLILFKINSSKCTTL